MIDTEVIFQITSVASIIVLCIAFNIIVKEFKESDKSNLFKNMLLSTTIIILVIIDVQQGYVFTFSKEICIIGMLAIYCNIVYNVNWFENIMYTSAYMYLYDIINYSLYWVTLGFEKDYDAGYLDVKTFILSTVFLVMLTKVIRKFKNIESHKLYYIFIAVAIIGNLITIIFTLMVGKSVFYSNNQFLNIGGTIISSMLPWIMIVCNIALILVVKKIIKDVNVKAENKVIKEKMNMQYNYYLGLQESQNKVKRLYHDINNHMICMKNICESKHTTDAYIESINKDIKDYNSMFNTGNMILDIVLNEKKFICENSNIHLFCDMNFSKCDFIEMIDVCSIFSNILDNAIEACNKISDANISKSIKIRGTIVKKYFVIKCENSKIDKVVVKKNKLITTKKDKEFHGIGIESVKNSLKKYDGELEFKDLENEFIVKIYIPLQENMTVGELKRPLGSSVLKKII